jgi:hypothetical protein
LALRVENPRPTPVLLDPKAKIKLTSTTQRSRLSITPKSRPIEQINNRNKLITCKPKQYNGGGVES